LNSNSCLPACQPSLVLSNDNQAFVLSFESVGPNKTVLAASLWTYLRLNTNFLSLSHSSECALTSKPLKLPQCLHYMYCLVELFKAQYLKATLCVEINLLLAKSRVWLRLHPRARAGQGSRGVSTDTSYTTSIVSAPHAAAMQP